ncbi:exonuclease V a 5' deoxyribonuclease-domain-containing protein [Flammula alnicola]|nr:exonuclease V a 5' deoxyribonuclease-domain-containing protein [Flammula alnicola]
MRRLKCQTLFAITPSFVPAQRQPRLNTVVLKYNSTCLFNAIEGRRWLLECYIISFTTFLGLLLPPRHHSQTVYQDEVLKQRLFPHFRDRQNREMTEPGSDDFPGLNFSDFTEEDFEKIDAAVASSIGGDEPVADASFESEINGLNLSTLTPQELAEIDAASSQCDTLPLDEEAANSSFQSDMFDINLGALSAEELALLDAAILLDVAIPTNDQLSKEGPSVEIEIEDLDGSASGSSLAPHKNDESLNTAKTWHNKTPLERFRSYMPLSVTDLVSPAWCEVQFDYGLRGKRSRPVSERPKSFVSSAGKTISPAVTVAIKNEVRTRQGQAVHKELEREIKFEELEVDITTPETRWALRIVNMLACLKGVLDGFTREMPVFGILHGEIVVGIMDEVIKVETPLPSDDTPNTKSPKRPSTEPNSSPGSKRARTDRSSSQTPIDRFFQSPKKSANNGEAMVANTEPKSEKRGGYTLYIKDNKTRKSEYLPSEDQMYSGKMQLMIYRRLLSELVATNPPYDFTPLWKKLGVDTTEIFPTKFLVQAQLIQDSALFQTTCLDDLVDSWHKLVKESNIIGVDPHLELVYRLRPPSDRKGKGKTADVPLSEVINGEDEELVKAIAASLEEASSGERNVVAGPSNFGNIASAAAAEGVETLETNAVPSNNPTNLLLDAEDAELQWALQHSMMPQHCADTSRPSANPLPANADSTNGKGKGKGKSNGTEEGIRRFRIIGTKQFLDNTAELDNHLTQVFKWWRGERKPEGVSLEHSYRCSTCEYADDCEWRAQKALEYSSRNKT